MEFSQRTELLSRDDFVCLDDKEKLRYFSCRLPSLEKKVLLSMINSCWRGDDPAAGDIIQHVAMCYDSLGTFDPEKFQYVVAKLVMETATSVAHGIWTTLFNYLSTEQAKLMVKQSISKIQQANSDLDSTSLTYGEIDFFSFANILDRVRPQQGEVFADLGHGTGKGFSSSMLCVILLSIFNSACLSYCEF